MEFTNIPVQYEGRSFSNATRCIILKESSNIKTSNININTFEMYFKAINDPADPFFQSDDDILYFNERYFQNELNIMFSELNVEISRFEEERAVQQLKLGRSGGPDLFMNEFIYYGKMLY